MALTYEKLSLTRFAQIVPANSPLIGTELDLANAAKDADVSPYLLLAWLRAENDFAVDISPGLLAVHNAAGIKYVGQARATESDQYPPSNEQGVYAGFASWADFYYTLAVNIKTILPDAWARGDLASIASYYTSGYPDRGAGADKVTFFNEYEGGNVVDTGVYGEDIINYVRTLVGQAYSTAETDPVNGVHPWAYWCESLAERAPEHLGLPEVARGSAELKRQALAAQGLLQQGTPEHGAWMLFDTRFYAPDGHICFWDADKGMVLGTLTDGTGLGWKQWGPQTYGYAGWARVPGVVGEHRGGVVPAPVPPDSHPVMETNWIQGSPYDQNKGVKGKELGIGGGFLNLYRATTDPFQTWGWVKSNEQQVIVKRQDGTTYRCTGQEFERGWMLYQPQNPAPWDCVRALDTEVVVPL